MYEGAPISSDTNELNELPPLDAEISVPSGEVAFAANSENGEQTPGFDYETDPNYREFAATIERLKPQIAELDKQIDRAAGYGFAFNAAAFGVMAASLTGMAVALGSGPEILQALQPARGLPSLFMVSGSSILGLLTGIAGIKLNERLERGIKVDWATVREKTKEFEAAVLASRGIVDAELVKHGAAFDSEGHLQNVSPEDIMRAAQQAEAAGKMVNLETQEEMSRRLEETA